MACSYLKIFPYRKDIKTVKNGGFCEELPSENNFEAVLVNFCCYEWGANASEAVQKDTAEVMPTHQNS